MSTSINIKRLYNHTYLQTARSSLGRPTVAVLFDAKKAFDTVWHEGLIHKSIVDNLPNRFIFFLKSWLSNRKLQVKIGGILSDKVDIRSGVPQGALLSPLLWNYWTGDCPTTKRTTSDSALYADDCAVWTTQTSVAKTIAEIQDEIWTLNDWTKRKRIKFEPSKTKVLACHQDKKKREEIKTHKLYLDREKTEVLSWDKNAVFLGVTFSEDCKFTSHWDGQIKKASARINTLWRFRGTVSGTTLYKVYKRAIEPIVTYASEVLYDSLTDIDLKKLLALEFKAIRLAYGLSRTEPISECLQYINKSVVTMIDERREKFIAKNHDRQVIMHTEILKHSEGRRIPCRNNFAYKGTPRGWQSVLYKHKDFVYFSGGVGTLARGGILLEGIRAGECLPNVPREPQVYKGNLRPKLSVKPWRAEEHELRDRETQAKNKYKSAMKKLLQSDKSTSCNQDHPAPQKETVEQTSLPHPESLTGTTIVISAEGETLSISTPKVKLKVTRTTRKPRNWYEPEYNEAQEKHLENRNKNNPQNVPQGLIDQMNIILDSLEDDSDKRGTQGGAG